MPQPQLFADGRRWLSLYLPFWATDWLKRADPKLGASLRPLALWEKQQGAMRLAAVDATARAEGLAPGHNLADARAQVPELEVREIDRPALQQAFEDFADWHSNASPIVAVLTDQAEFGDLVLDISGVSHLFGGEGPMLARLTERLQRLGYSVQGGIAGTAGAAWALSHFAPGRIVGDDAESVLAELPINALRLTDVQTDALRQMGLKRVGQLYGRPRGALQARFGASLVLRLDQALGRVTERVSPRLPALAFCCEQRFPEPIGLLDDVLAIVRDLAVKLAVQLEQERLGAQSFHLYLYRVDHKVMTLSVNAARATRDAEHIAHLFAHRSERLEGEYDPGFGIDMVRLAAGSTAELASTQLGAFEVRNGAEDLDRLYDRMASRLGPLSVLRSKPINTHLPEQAVRLEPAVARTPDDALGWPGDARRRPLRLLPQPEPVTVAFAQVPDGPPPNMTWRRMFYRFPRAAGPERIGVEWWTLPRPRPQFDTDGNRLAAAGDDGAALTRDYFIAEDEAGVRFWLFREGFYGSAVEPRWFLHGLFA